MAGADPWQQLLGEVARSWPPDRWRDLGVVIGCSGGADSVSLTHALASLRQPAAGETTPPRGFLLVAHFNHRLRGRASDDDQESVVALSRELDLRCRCGRAETPRSDEASMRSARLQFLVDVAHRAGARYLALAHSADDNVETVLHHLMRGTGPAGLAGIGSPRAIDTDLVLVRPLLGTSRQLIRAALNDAGISWREDASNLDLGYGRNWIRHELIPVIESRYPHASEAIGRAVAGQRQWRQIIDRLAAQWLDEHLVCLQPMTLRRDRDAEPAIVIAAIQMLWTQADWPRGKMTQSHWLQVAQTLSSTPPQRYALPAGIEVVAKADQVTIGLPLP